MRALGPVDARADDLVRELSHVIYLSVMLSMAVLALLGLINLRSRLAAVYLLYLATQTTAFVALNGYLAHFLPAAHVHWGDTITSILVLAAAATGVLFYRNVFRDYAASALGLRVLDVFLLVFIFELCLLGLGRAGLALQINGNVVLMLGLLAPVIALSMRAGPERERRIIRWLIWLQAGAVTMVMPLLGLLSARVEWILDASLGQGVVAAAVMCAILHQRTRGLVEARRHAEMEMKMTHSLLDAERKRAAEQARFMDMLTHELKTPIAAVKMVFQLPEASDSARRHELTTLDDMDAVVERCRQLDLLQQGRFTPRREPFRVDGLMAEILASCSAPDRLRLATGPVCDVESDQHLLKIVISNLVDNALKYSAPGSDIDCHIERREGEGRAHIHLSIENHPGPAGLPDPDKLFEKYYRSRLKQSHPDLGVIVVNVRDRLDDKLGAYECGADLYLTKPVSVEELCAAAAALGKRLLRVSRPPRRDFSLDLQQMRLRGPAGETPLTAQEATVLAALVRAPGHRLETWQLLEQLGWVDTSGKMALEVPMSRLRRKFTLVGAATNPLIAIRKHGYQLGCAVVID